MALAAWMMTLATTPGSVIDRWGVDLGDVGVCPVGHEQLLGRGDDVVGCANDVPGRDGYQAGTPDWSVNVLVARGRWVAASTAPALAGRPLAKQPGNTVGLT